MRNVSKICLIATALLVPLGAVPVSADPGVCANPCTIGASNTRYDPPVAIIENNTTVDWHSTDVGHIQAETQKPVGSTGACFTVSAPGGGNSPSVRFEIQGSVLNATVGSTTKTCSNAVPVPGVGFAVAYQCLLHPQIRGAIVVKA